MHELHWSIDSLVVRGNTIFGFGWIFHTTQSITNVFISRAVEDSTLVAPKIPVEFGKLREDVAHAFKKSPQAANSGFLVLGRFPLSSDRNASLILECYLANGTVLTQAIPASAIVDLNDLDNGATSIKPHSSLVSFFRRGLYFLRKGEFALLFNKARTLLYSNPKRSLNSPKDLGQLLLANERKQVTWWVDHDLGGGANLYRRTQADKMIAEGRTVIVLSFHVRTLLPVLLIQNERVRLSFSIPDLDFALESARGLIIDQVIYNNAVSFPDSEQMPDFLLRLKAASRARLLILVHDFFVVCPSHFLLDHTGKYCDIPEPKRCANCMPQNRYGFVTLFAGQQIENWRYHWSNALNAADEVRVFSRNSGTLIQRAYPDISNDKIRVLPHTVSHFTRQKIKIVAESRLRVGIMGNIGHHKGSHVVHGLAQAIKDARADAEIYVIGTLEGKADPEIISQTGSYAHDQLPQLIQNTKVNVMLFPSIWPETFSYVVQELMEMELPVAAFDFGAPAERLRCYSRGLILGDKSPPAILKALQNFHRTLYFS